MDWGEEVSRARRWCREVVHCVVLCCRLFSVQGVRVCYYDYKLSVLICVRNYLVYAFGKCLKNCVRRTNACGAGPESRSARDGRRRSWYGLSWRDFVSMIWGGGDLVHVFSVCVCVVFIFSFVSYPHSSSIKDYIHICVYMHKKLCLDFWVGCLMNAGWFLFRVFVFLRWFSDVRWGRVDERLRGREGWRGGRDCAAWSAVKQRL